MRLDSAGFAESAAADREPARAVTAQKIVFFAESTPEGESIDYRLAINGALALAPCGEAREVLAEDYARMLEDGLLLGDAELFHTLLEHCQGIAEKVNAMVRADP